MGMKRLLTTLAATVLLCAASAGLASAAITPTAHGSMVTRHVKPTLPRPAVSAPANQATAAAEVAAQAMTAMHAVLPNARVGFEVFDRQTGGVLTSQNADQQFASMSVVKLFIALDMLAHDNQATPDGATQQELHQMLADSDDEIANRLWSVDGGPAIVTRMADLLGLTGTRPPADPGEWGDTLITPQDIVTVYRYITDQLPETDRDLILGALADAPRSAADGFDQYFGIPDGIPHTTWAIKQGWGTSGSQAVMNSTGLVGTNLRYVVVVLASASADSYSTIPAVVTAGAGALVGLVGPATS